MKYLIFYNNEVFYTKWFDEENNYVEGMLVVNVQSDKYFNGKEWLDIKFDHL